METSHHGMKASLYTGLWLLVSASSSLAGEVCTGGMVPKAPGLVKGGSEPSCPPAACADACAAIPASSVKTGETVSVYPRPGEAFSYRLNREGVTGAAQEYCYTVKNWSNSGERSYNLCVQFKDE
jgi:hypothetical protein